MEHVKLASICRGATDGAELRKETVEGEGERWLGRWRQDERKKTEGRSNERNSKFEEKKKRGRRIDVKEVKAIKRKQQKGRQEEWKEEETKEIKTV